MAATFFHPSRYFLEITAGMPIVAEANERARSGDLVLIETEFPAGEIAPQTWPTSLSRSICEGSGPFFSAGEIFHAASPESQTKLFVETFGGAKVTVALGHLKLGRNPLEIHEETGQVLREFELNPNSLDDDTVTSPGPMYLIRSRDRRTGWRGSILMAIDVRGRNYEPA